MFCKGPAAVRPAADHGEGSIVQVANGEPCFRRQLQHRRDRGDSGIEVRHHNDAWAPLLESASPMAAWALRATACNPSRSPCASRTSPLDHRSCSLGNLSLTSPLDNPDHAPRSSSRSRLSTVSGNPQRRPMATAVSRARSKSLLTSWSGMSLATSAATCSASPMPSALRGTSSWPMNRSWPDHVLLPCLTKITHSGPCT